MRFLHPKSNSFLSRNFSRSHPALICTNSVTYKIIRKNTFRAITFFLAKWLLREEIYFSTLQEKSCTTNYNISRHKYRLKGATKFSVANYGLFMAKLRNSYSIIFGYTDKYSNNNFNNLEKIILSVLTKKRKKRKNPRDFKKKKISLLIFQLQPKYCHLDKVQ